MKLMHCDIREKFRALKNQHTKPKKSFEAIEKNCTF